MSKSDIPLSDLDITKAVKTQNKPKFKEDKAINAFDTETSNGDVFMVSYAFEQMSGEIDSGSTEELESSEVWDLLTYSGCRDAINVWYNLDFDANALLSGLLNMNELAKLVIKNRVNTQIGKHEYVITYVKSKFLSIKNIDTNHRFDHYDIAQYFYTSLNDAASEWINEQKKEGIDTTMFSSDVCSKHTKEALNKEKEPQPNGNCSDCVTEKEAKQYVENNYSEIREYAEKDATVTKKLAVALFNEGERLDIPFGKPFSTGWLSAEYQRANTSSKPNFGNKDIQAYLWESYHGGRFEVFERGNVGEVVGPDINSAYPAIMAKLPSPTTLDWKVVNNNENDGYTFDFEDITECDYGVVKINVSTNTKAKIQPFAFKIDAVTSYPALEDTTIIVLKDIFEFAVKNGLVTDYTLIDGYLGYETERTEYPFSWIEDLYAERKVSEQLHNLEKKAKLLKIVLNSSYGKTCQTTTSKRLVQLDEGENYRLEDNERLYPKDYLSNIQREYVPDDTMVIETNSAGKRFNPFFASYITGLTRLELHKRVTEYDLVEDTYMFATDCIMVDKDAYEKSGFDSIVQVADSSLEEPQFREMAKDSLGMWDFDYSGNAFIVGSGVYEIVLPNGDIKTKTRGFTKSALDGQLVEMANKHPNGIPLENNRPITLGEMFQNPDVGNVASFTKMWKELKPNFDSKRDWNVSNPSFIDLLNSSHGGKPLTVNENPKYTNDEVVISQIGRIEG